eukprot:8627839-Pyramimonas_sp.AAC.1
MPTEEAPARMAAVCLNFFRSESGAPGADAPYADALNRPDFHNVCTCPPAFVSSIARGIRDFNFAIRAFATSLRTRPPCMSCPRFLMHFLCLIFNTPAQRSK